jgi:hypothetical protein
MRLASLAAAGLVAAAVAAATTAQSTPELIGFASNPMTAATAIVRQDFGTCATQRCSPPMLPAVNRVAGGTAYDATRGGVWISNGTSIGVFDANTCATDCQPSTVPLPANAVVTGLAVNERARTLLISDSGNRIHQFALRCPLSVSQAPCDVGPALPPGHVIGGLACDDVRDLVFYTASDFVGPTPDNVLYVARRASACAPFCRIPIRDCGTTPLGALTGVAFDPCRDVVWVTDGRLTVGMRIDVPNCRVVETQCCRLTLGVEYQGLCIKPSQAASTGSSCTAAICAACPTLRHDVVGDAALGNPAFSLNLEDAPANARALLALGVGPCGPGLVVPPFCGPFHVPLAPTLPTIVGPFGTGGTVGCTGRVGLTLAVPANPAFCGLTLSSQWFGLCPGPIGFGTFVSNCQSWTISGT